MDIKAKVKVVDTYVQDWMEEYISSFPSVQAVAYKSLEFATVNAMVDWLHNWLCDLDEQDLEDAFHNISIDEFMDFFFKYNQTFVDVYNSWICGDEPSSEDILSLRSYGEQTEGILNNIRFILDDIKRILDDVKRTENSQKEVQI